MKKTLQWQGSDEYSWSAVLHFALSSAHIQQVGHLTLHSATNVM